MLISVPGPLGAEKKMEMPSSGWMFEDQAVGFSFPATKKRRAGARLNWMTISVVRLARRLPVRR